MHLDLRDYVQKEEYELSLLLIIIFTPCCSDNTLNTLSSRKPSLPFFSLASNLKPCVRLMQGLFEQSLSRSPVLPRSLHTSPCPAPEDRAGSRGGKTSKYSENVLSLSTLSVNSWAHLPPCTPTQCPESISGPATAKALTHSHHFHVWIHLKPHFPWPEEC